MGKAHKNLVQAAFVFLAALLCTAALAGTTTSFTMTAKSYAGSRDRQVKVYVPDNVTTPAPLVMALHGCQQTHDDVLRDWGLTAAADRFGFILVTPFITSYDGLRNTNCWGFWLDGHRHEGRGEPEDLHQIAREVEARFSIDPARRYITGLSSGGAMAAVAAVTHNEYWAAAASASGLPYGEDAAAVSFSGCPGFATFHAISRVASDMRAELDDSYAIALMVLQNSGDCTVLQQAGNNLRDAQLAVFGDAAHDTPAEARAVTRVCEPAFAATYDCQHVMYTVDGRSGSRSLVETIFYSGPVATPDTQDTDHGHYWIGGEFGNNGKWSLRNGPSYPDIVWDFFVRHPRAAVPPNGAPLITLSGANPLHLQRGQAFTDPGATANDAEDGSVPVSADCSSVDTSRAGTYACTYRATDSAGNTATATRTVVVEEAPGVPPSSCATQTASPAAHIAAGRAVFGGFFNLRAVSNADRRDIGFAWDYFTQVSLQEGAAGQWYAGAAPGCSP
ncbi:MAG TPA: PHB depolymerase family esterase [Burkholderiaceae bacterium]|nr:PHB depolymerase family esterase [Burkholderiaceae bacterium]